MTNPVLATVGMLMGILMIVCGVLVALLTGLDIIYGSIGLLVAAAGGALSRFCHREAPVQSDNSSGTPERSIQKPVSPSDRSKFDKKI